MERNSKKTKILASAAAVVLAVSMIIGGGTYAYLQSETEDTVNKFNANQVVVDLDETTGSEYEIIPGTVQGKDPKVTVNATVPAYVYVTVDDKTDGLVDYEIADGWTKLDGYDNVYYREVAASDEAQAFYVLADNQVSYAAALENSDMTENGQLKDGLELTFKAYAIQKDPFNDPAEAYIAKDAPVVNNAQSLQDSINDGSAVIIVDGDVQVTEPVTIPNGKNVKLVIAGSVSAEGTDTIVVEKGGSLEIDGGTVIAAPKKSAVTNEGTAVLSNVTVERSSESTTNDCYTIINHGKMTLEESVTVKSPAGGLSMIENGYPNGSTATNFPEMIIEGGTYIGGLNPIKNDDRGILKINGGYFENNDENQYCVINMNELYINGGEFYSDGSVLWTGSLDTGYDKGLVYIYDGYFETKKSFYAFYVYHDKGGYTDAARYYIGGGIIKMNAPNITEIRMFVGPTGAYEKLEGIKATFNNQEGIITFAPKV